MDYNLPDSLVHGFGQARILLFLSPGDLPNLEIKPRSPVLQADFSSLSHQGSSLILHIETDVLRINILRVIQVLNSENISNQNNSRNKNLMFKKSA